MIRQYIFTSLIGSYLVTTLWFIHVWGHIQSLGETLQILKKKNLYKFLELKVVGRVLEYGIEYDSMNITKNMSCEFSFIMSKTLQNTFQS